MKNAFRVTMLIISVLTFFSLLGCTQNVITLKVDYGYDFLTQTKEVILKNGEDGALLKDFLVEENPTREGYVFLGWFFGEQKIDYETFEVTSNIMISARWTVSYKVIINYNNGSADLILNVAEGSEIVGVNQPVYDEYSFLGWYVGDLLVDINKYKVYQNVTVSAKWDNKHQVVFKDGAGNDALVLEVLDKEHLTSPDILLTRPMYIFSGWAKDEEGTELFDFENEIITEDIILYPYWELKAIEDLELTSEPLKTEYLIGEQLDLTGIEIRVIFTDQTEVFLEEEDITTTGFDSSLASDSLEVKAYFAERFVTFNLKVYSRVLNSFSETFEDSALSGTYQDGQLVGINGIVFSYWYARNTSGGYQIDGKGILLGSVSDTNKPAISFTLNTGNLIELSFKYRKAYTGASKREYQVELLNAGKLIKFSLPEFGSTSGEDSTIYSFSQELSLSGQTDIKIYGLGGGQITIDDISWKEQTIVDIEKEIVVRFDTNGASEISPMVVEKGTVLKIEVLNRVGYTFGGWFLDSHFNKPFSLNTAVTESITLYAKWEKSSSVYEGYYGGLGLETKKGLELQETLRDRLGDGFSGISYGDVRYALLETDVHPDNPDKIYSIYDSKFYNKTWDNGATWNREHIWCQSHLGASASNGRINIASDLHNLRVLTTSTNSSRNNRYYDDGNRVSDTGYTLDPYGYFPGDSHKGDVARILMYMETFYSQLTLTDKIYSRDSKELEFSMKSVLIRWHLEDPVDEFEVYRNDKVFEYQGNRNPFIDHPELVSLIYGTSKLNLNRRSLSALSYFEFKEENLAQFERKSFL